MRRTLAIAACLAILAPGIGTASGRYDPRLRFQTLSTPRFDIHYHQGEEREARRLAKIAEAVAAKLDATLGRPSGRVQVILVNQSDLANGWATVFPVNTIEIAAAVPPGQSFIGNTSDWMQLVFAHEYAHIVHLSRGQGWIGGLRRVFGRMPLLYPNAYLPVFQIEGLAVYEESALTGQGRVPAGDFRAVLGVASTASRFDPLDRASGRLVDWPSGHTPYVYGGYFHQFLAERYGEASLRLLTDDTARRLPYFGSRAFKNVFKRSLGELWQEFETASRRDERRPGSDVTRLTHHGFNVVGPRFAPDGRLYYSVVTPDGFPALYSLGPGETQPRRVADRYLGGSIGVTESTLVFDQIEVANQVALQSDLYSIGTSGGRARRLTHGAHAALPDVSPDGRSIVCVIQQADRRELALLNMPAGSERAGEVTTLISEPGVSFDSPRWSPDGRWIAAERGISDIVLIDAVARRVVKSIAASVRGRSVTPAWTPDGASIVFASDREGGGFYLYRTDVATLETWRLEGTGADARSPEISRDGRSLVFVGYTADGYDVFRMALESARWTRATDSVFRAEPMGLQHGGEATVSSPSARTYTPWRTLAPRFWMPAIELDNDELVIGAATAAVDALGRHAYSVEAGWTTSRGRPDWQVAYAYDRWWPTLFANVIDDTDPWRDGEVRTKEANAGVLLPFRRVRWSQSLLGAFHVSTDTFRCSACGPRGEADVDRATIRAGWLVDAARSYGYSISLEDGWSASATTEFAREALGADGDGGAATLDVRGYLPVGPRHSVVAARIAGASSWGDERAARVFSASGNGPQPIRFDFDSDAIGLLRGLDDSDLLGRHAASVNLDYRFPLMRIERGAGTLPIFARVVHGALFVGAAHAWDTTFRGQDVRVAAGAELSLDAVIGYVLPVTFTTGATWVSHDRGFAVFGRIGRAF